MPTVKKYYTELDGMLNKIQLNGRYSLREIGDAIGYANTSLSNARKKNDESVEKIKDRLRAVFHKELEIDSKTITPKIDSHLGATVVVMLNRIAKLLAAQSGNSFEHELELMKTEAQSLVDLDKMRS